MNIWNCIIVDDEDVDRLMVVSFAKRFPSLNIIGSYKSAEEALPVLEKEKIDVLFLDIDMPGFSGVEFKKKQWMFPFVFLLLAMPNMLLRVLNWKH